MYAYNDFTAGRVIIAINKDCVQQITPASFENSIFGIEINSIEVLFQNRGPADNDDNIGAIVMIHLRTNNPQAVIRAIERLTENPCVVFAEPDFYLEPHVIPNDPYFGELWGLRKIECPSAWSYAVGTGDVIVGVTDSGINSDHPDLRDNVWTAPRGQGKRGWNFEENNNQCLDNTGHGTHVAGTVGAVGNNYMGVTGVNWRVTLASLKIGNSVFNMAAAINAIDYANRNRIQILNNSWGTKFFSSSLKYAIDHYGGLFVVSAGNSGTNNDIAPVYPCSYNSKNLISVAAVNRDNDLAAFSNYGAVSVDIAAPGTDILSTSLGSRYSYLDGTSMAAPHVAGAAALLKGYRPELTPLEIKDIILSNADKNARLSGKVLTGGTINIKKMFESVSVRLVPAK